MTYKNTRRQARIYCLQYLFQEEKQNGCKNIPYHPEMTSLKKNFSIFEKAFPHQLDERNCQYIIELLEKVALHYTEIKQLIAESLDKTSAENIPRLDYLILLQSVAEMTFLAQTPAKVIINEAVEMAKAFSHKDSSSLINAVLDKISRNNEK